jgi:hypothetical protein
VLVAGEPKQVDIKVEMEKLKNAATAAAPAASTADQSKISFDEDF